MYYPVNVPDNVLYVMYFNTNVHQCHIITLRQVSLSRLAMLSPPVPPSSCSAPELPPRPSCTAQPGLTGDLLPRPRKLVLMMLFSFEVTSLDILNIGIYNDLCGEGGRAGDRPEGAARHGGQDLHRGGHHHHQRGENKKQDRISFTELSFVDN